VLDLLHLTLDDLPDELTEAEAEFDVDRLIPPNVPLPEALEKTEEKLIRRALLHCNNVQFHAPKMLGITKNLIEHNMKKYQYDTI
jgi:two-component system NtrC family response regulator